MSSVLFKLRGLGLVSLLALFTLLALLFTPQTYLLNARVDLAYRWTDALISNLILFHTWTLLTPAIIWLGRHLPIERRHLLRNLVLLIIAGINFALLHILILKYMALLLNLGQGNSATNAPIGNLLIGLGATDIMIYFGIIAASQAINNFLRWQDREYRLTQAQLQTLKAQLHPHFLFNTLNAISELVYDNPKLADQAIVELSELLRSSLARDQMQEVSLAQELELLKKYLAIQQLLLSERLAINYQIDETTVNAAVPCLMLQPLAENAVRHGIAPRPEGGRLEIVSRREATQLVLLVRDNGCGLASKTACNGNGIGIGLANLQARLLYLYGAQQSFQISETAGGGVTITIAIPFHELAKA